MIFAADVVKRAHTNTAGRENGGGSERERASGAVMVNACSRSAPTPAGLPSQSVSGEKWHESWFECNTTH